MNFLMADKVARIAAKIREREQTRMVRRCSVAMVDGVWEWQDIFIHVTDTLSPAHWPYEHWVPLNFVARDLQFLLRAGPGHAVFYDRAICSDDILLRDVWRQVDSVFEVLSDDSW